VNKGKLKSQQECRLVNGDTLGLGFPEVTDTQGCFVYRIFRNEVSMYCAGIDHNVTVILAHVRHLPQRRSELAPPARSEPTLKFLMSSYKVVVPKLLRNPFVTKHLVRNTAHCDSFVVT